MQDVNKEFKSKRNTDEILDAIYRKIGKELKIDSITDFFLYSYERDGKECDFTNEKVLRQYLKYRYCDTDSQIVTYTDMLIFDCKNHTVKTIDVLKSYDDLEKESFYEPYSEENVRDFLAVRDNPYITSSYIAVPKTLLDDFIVTFKGYRFGSRLHPFKHSLYEYYGIITFDEQLNIELVKKPKRKHKSSIKKLNTEQEKRLFMWQIENLEARLDSLKDMCKDKDVKVEDLKDILLH